MRKEGIYNALIFIHFLTFNLFLELQKYQSKQNKLKNYSQEQKTFCFQLTTKNSIYRLFMSANQKEKVQRKIEGSLILQEENKDKMSIDEPQIYLRSDLNNLFDNMAVSSNFNLRKISQEKHNESKRISKGQSVEVKLINLVNQTKPTRGSLSGNETKGLGDSIYASNKKYSGTSEWSKDNQGKKGIANMENLNKMLKKNDSFSFGIANREAVSLNKLKGNFGLNSTFQVPENGQEQKTQFSSTKYAMNRTQQHQKGIRSKIMSMTSKVTHRFSTQIAQDDQRQLAKMKHTKRTETEQNEVARKQKIQDRKNTYNELEKKFNKGGPLKFKHVENWLNNIIQEYCHDEYFDPSLGNAALKKYYIDSNSLMSKGVDPNDVNRIYNSLFVYSIGFNNLLKQISKGNKELVKNIWKIYSLLLEYCAAGSYETVVGEIERDKLRKVQELKMEIQKRQEMIERNEELNEEKNSNMFKELKRLKDQNLNLANQREILMEDFQQADQAFNEEVSLRLKFQNTINEIYSVHKELESKHGRLFQDFQIKIQEVKKSSEKYFLQTKSTQQYKYELIEVKEKYNEQKKINLHDKEHIQVLLIQLSNMKENYFRTTKELEQAKSIILEKDRKLQQMLDELNNIKIILQLREKSAKQTHAEYQITLQENNKLFSVISQQRLEMQGLLLQKKDFNQSVLRILSESSYYKKKYESIQGQIKTLNQKIVNGEVQHHKMEVQNDILSKEIDNLKNDLQNNYDSIRKMHQRNFQLEQELAYLRKFQGNMDGVMGEKNDLIQLMKDKIHSLQTKIIEATHDFINLESRHQILQTQLRAEKEINLKKLEDFKKEQQLMTNNQSSLAKMLKQAQLQADKFRSLLNNTLLDLKNQKFQRTNLTLTYQQILKVLENKNAEQKQASIKINELKEEVLLYKEKYKLTHLNLLNTTDELTNKISQLNKKIADQKEVLDYKAHHQHPMHYEDVFHKYIRQSQEHEKTKQDYENKLYVKDNTIKQLNKQIQQITTQNKLQINKLQQNFSKKIEKLNGEIEYEKENNKKLKTKLNALEILESTYKQKIYLFELKQAEEKRQQKLMEELKLKNGKIKQLHEEISNITQTKKEEISNLEKRIKEVENEKLDFVYQFKTKKERQIREQIDKKYQVQMLKMKEIFEEEIKSKRFKFSPRFNEFVPGSPEEIQYKNFFKEMVQNQSLDQILKIKKEQFESRNDEESRNFSNKIERFFKRSISSQNNDLNAGNNLLSNSMKSTQRDVIKSLYKGNRDNIPAYLQHASEEFKVRGSIARKLKNAHEYYGRI